MNSILDNPIVKSAINSSQRTDHFNKIREQLIDDEVVQTKHQEALNENPNRQDVRRDNRRQ